MISKLRLYLSFDFLFVFSFFSIGSVAELLPRESYSIDLPRITVAINDTTGKCNHVRISFENSDDYVIIGEFDDLNVKSTRNGVEKMVFRESMEKSYQLTGFEAEQINKVCKYFIETLEQFESNLQNEHWGRCLYLDAYLPRFLDGFYFLMNVARNALENMPPEAHIPDSLYDVSQNSPKTDERILKWRVSTDNVVKLRIATKELIFQTRAWQKKELANSKRDVEMPSDSEFIRSLLFFERVYFNRDSSPVEKK